MIPPEVRTLAVLTFLLEELVTGLCWVLREDRAEHLSQDETPVLILGLGQWEIFLITVN